MPFSCKMNLEQYYVEISIFLASVLGGLALKDYSVSFIKGLKFKLNSQFNEGDKVLLDGEQAMIIKIGMGTTVFGVYGKDGYTWRYISNTKIESLKLEKIVDKDLHQDSAYEKKQKLERILRGEKND
jgi:adenylosuccinate synthase